MFCAVICKERENNLDKILENIQDQLLNQLAEDLNLIDENKVILLKYIKTILEIEKIKGGEN